MEVREMSQDEIGKDPILDRVRKCGRCSDGLMVCRSMTQHAVNGGYAGRDYIFVCTTCRHLVQDFNLARVLYQAMVLVLCGGFGGVLLFFGLRMGLDTWQRGFGGNDASAVVVVLALFILGGGGLFALALYTARGLYQDARDRRASPIFRAPAASG